MNIFDITAKIRQYPYPEFAKKFTAQVDQYRKLARDHKAVVILVTSQLLNSDKPLDSKSKCCNST